jgi:hypothetical protein
MISAYKDDCPQLEFFVTSSISTSLKIRCYADEIVTFLSSHWRALRKIRLAGVTFDETTGFFKVLDCIKILLHLDEIILREIGISEGMGAMREMTS